MYSAIPCPPVPGMDPDPLHLPALVQAHVHIGAFLVVDHTADLPERLPVVPLDLGLAQVLGPLLEVIVDIELAALHCLVAAVAGHEFVIDAKLALPVVVDVVIGQAGKKRVVFAALDVLGECWREEEDKRQPKKKCIHSYL